MPELLAWLTALPQWALYGAMAIMAALENVFPPLPADVVVAFGAFLAARGEGAVAAAFLATWIGNVIGAMLMYGSGRRYGARWMERWMKKTGEAKFRTRFESLYRRYGLLAIFLSRFLPGVRAVVPPFAGALGLPTVPVFVMLAIPSAIWYGAITVVAFRVGENWEVALARIGTLQFWMVGFAAAIAIIIAVAIYVRRRNELRTEAAAKGADAPEHIAATHLEATDTGPIEK